VAPASLAAADEEPFAEDISDEEEAISEDEEMDTAINDQITDDLSLDTDPDTAETYADDEAELLESLEE
ncbi:MAG: hypothetical protein LUB61_04850, partial [Eggerthellaceae bacterium]|nr:hypothetical protein [Eggerthellaceae bacterium]